MPAPASRNAPFERYACEIVRLRPGTIQALRIVAALCDTGLSAIFSAAWGVYLSQQNGSENVAFGFLDRESADLNTPIAPVGLGIQRNRQLIAWLPDVAVALDARSGSAPGGRPIDTAVILSTGWDGPLSDPASSGLSLTLHIYKEPEGDVCVVGLRDERRYRDHTLLRVLEHFSTLLDHMAARPDLCLSALPAMPKPE